MRRTLTYSSAYLFERGAYTMRKLGFTLACKECLPDGRIEVIWVKN